MNFYHRTISSRIYSILESPKPPTRICEPLALDTVAVDAMSRSTAPVWAVPAEYANSPIAKELAESVEEVISLLLFIELFRKCIFKLRHMNLNRSDR